MTGTRPPLDLHTVDELLRQLRSLATDQAMQAARLARLETRLGNIEAKVRELAVRATLRRSMREREGGVR